MSTDISVQTTTFGGSHPIGFPSPRPDDLPLSAAVWDAADKYGKPSHPVIEALFEAVKHLEAAQEAD